MVSIFLVISNITILNAKESKKIGVNIFCVDAKKDIFQIELDSNKLYLTKDAVQDNVGGYVDIPEENFYLKTKNKVFRIKGVVEINFKNNINQFKSKILNNKENFINIEEVYSLKNKKNLKLIQKINLEENNRDINLKTKTSTIILDIKFNEKLFNTEYQKCNKKEEIKEKSFFEFFK